MMLIPGECNLACQYPAPHSLLTMVCTVFWVFGSSSVVGENVMLKMATSDVLSGPVRLLFPHAVAPGTHPSFPFSLLGEDPWLHCTNSDTGW